MMACRQRVFQPSVHVHVLDFGRGLSGRQANGKFRKPPQGFKKPGCKRTDELQRGSPPLIKRGSWCVKQACMLHAPESKCRMCTNCFDLSASLQPRLESCTEKTRSTWSKHRTADPLHEWSCCFRSPRQTHSATGKSLSRHGSVASLSHLQMVLDLQLHLHVGPASR